ncbi:hypothetical protein CGSHi6P18H1_01799 [Haemophilus influenzae 6P18H1]|nr:hypothetical protein CGSHi6P18H1_01799 [Haemophilus influenzae 6P18H1]
MALIFLSIEGKYFFSVFIVVHIFKAGDKINNFAKNGQQAWIVSIREN